LALRDLVEQMHAALTQAIADAESAGDVTYHGFEGRLLDQTGGRSTYQFRLKTAWEIADNARINVKDLEQTREVGARVVSQEATTLLLVTEEVLPSDILAHLLLVEDKTWLLKKERQALASLQETAGQPGAKTLGLIEPNRGTEPITERLCHFEPHPHQRQAIEQALFSEVTLIVGPPGTGKTTTLCEIMCHFLQQDRSVLLVSHTNIATDNAFLRLVQAIEEGQQDDLCALLDQGLLVRAGEPRHSALREGTYHDLTVNALAETRVGELIQECTGLEQRQQALEQQVKQAQIDLDRYSKEWQVQRKRLLSQCEELQQAARDWAFLTKQTEIQAKAQQELTRLCSEKDQLQKKREAWQQRKLEDARQWQAATTEYAQVQAMRWWQRLFSRWRGYNIAKQKANIEACYQDWKTAQQQITRLDSALSTNQFSQNEQKKIIKRSQQAEQTRREALKPRPLPPEQMLPQIEQQLAECKRALEEGEQAASMLQTQIKDASTERDMILVRLSALRARQETERARIIEEARLIATTITGVYLSPGLSEREFDVVVVDELSMISVIGVLLVVSRAHRQVIGAGDPMQLSPVVVLRQEQQAQLAREWLGKDLFTHLGISIFDAISGTKGCVLLTEQGRSHPTIIASINHYVYRESLTSRAETIQLPGIAPHPEWPLMLVDTTGSPAQCQKPNKNRARENSYHAHLVVAMAHKVLADLPPRSPGEDASIPRIAIVTPYRSQVTLIAKKLRAAGMANQVHVGTINTVQALEFPVVIFDTVEAPGGPRPWQFTFDTVFNTRQMATEATRKLNVAWTRAKQKLIVIAHRQHLHDALSQNVQDSLERQRLLWDLIEWAARAGYTHAQEFLDPDLSNEEQA